MELLKGQTLGDYAVLKEIGQGGAGRVYEVEHTITRRREAVKVVSFLGVGETERSERFLREIRLQAALNHPNIAAVHNAFWTDDNFILVSELLEGEPLQALLTRGKLNLERSIEIIRQVLAALRCAHSRGIMHRDISPANIFVTSAGPVKLIDFGLAKASTDLNLTQAGLAVGSFYYTSPEQIRAEPTIDIRTDLYSCGAVLYEMLTGQKPFDGTAFEVMQSHCERTPMAPSVVDARIPAPLCDVIMRALAKKPDDRFGSADEFLRRLEEITVAVPKPPALIRVTPLVLVGSAVLAGVVWFTLLRWHPKAEAAAPATAVPVAVQPEPPEEDLPKVELPKGELVKKELAKAELVKAELVKKDAPAVKSNPAPVRSELKPGASQSSDEPLPTDELTEPIETGTAAPPAVSTTPPDQPPPSRGVIGAVKKLNPFRKKKTDQQ